MAVPHAQSAQHVSKLHEYAACHCGHCFTTIAVSGETRRVRCPGCGRSNAIPHNVTIVCDRCHTTQRVRFSQRDKKPLCRHCGQCLDMGAIELIPHDRHASTSNRYRNLGHSNRHDSVVFTIMLYAVALILFLLWIMQ